MDYIRLKKFIKYDPRVMRYFHCLLSYFWLLAMCLLTFQTPMIIIYQYFGDLSSAVGYRFISLHNVNILTA